MSFADFEENERKQQQKYDDIKVSIKPTIVLSVKLLCFQNVSVGKIADFFDTPDPEFEVSCPKVAQASFRSFKTRNIKDNVTEGIINEEFRFVIPHDFDPNEEFPVVIKLSDRDVFFDDVIGSRTIDATQLEANGKPVTMMIQFGKKLKNGDLKIEIKKSKEIRPDFRFGFGLCQEEREFRKKRIPFVHKAMNNILGSAGPKDLLETPIVALVGSGGGYRATVGMCGAMEALNDAGLVDIATYNSALSGGAWYISAAYALQALLPPEQEKFHHGMRERLGKNILWELVSPSTMKIYRKYVKDFLVKNNLPQTFVNYFPGLLVSKHLYGQDKLHIKLSDLASYVDTGEVPYPLIVAIHVKTKVAANVFHDKIRIEDRKKAKTDLEASGRVAEIESEDDSDDEEPETKSNVELDSNTKESSRPESVTGFSLVPGAEAAIETTARYGLVSAFVPFSPGDEELPAIVKALRNTNLLSSRDSLVGRTAKLRNFALNCKQLERYHLNPFMKNINGPGLDAEQIKLIGIAGHKCMIKNGTLPSRPRTLSFVDAGILKNVPTDAVLRPQRGTDVMIVMDFSDNESDENFNYKSLIDAAAHAWQGGLRFPKIDIKEILKLPPKEFLIFPSDDDDCPTVLWFTVSNKKFRKLKDYTPKSEAKPPKKEQRAFNDFNVFGEGSKYSMFRFHYEKYHFDQLRELMYYNVSSHIEEIKQAVADAVERRRRRLRR